jgi:sucrose-6F-phosphate phosphohydrolase
MTENWLFVSDVDDTLLGDDTSLQELMFALGMAGYVTVAYNSSRPCASLRRSMAANPQLKQPDYLIGALGTEIEAGASGTALTQYTEFLGTQWQRSVVMTLAEKYDLTPHPAEYQTPLKASFDVSDFETATRFQQSLLTTVISAKVIFSGGKNLDVIPARAGKGGVIDYLRRSLKIDPERVVVAGDSGNDIEMFTAPYRGIVVGNADNDLRRLQEAHIYLARRDYAAGVLEGLRYWGVVG